MTDLNINLVLQGSTQSEMQMLDDCGMAWNYRYNQMLEPKAGFSWALVYGSWFHNFLEEWYRTKGKRAMFNPIKPPTLTRAVDMVDYQWWSKHGEMQANAYRSFYQDDHRRWKTLHTEHVADVEFQGIRLKGMLDLLIEDDEGVWIVDHKTCSRLDANTANGWQYRLQFMFYLWLARKVWPELKVKGFKVNAIKKTELRQKVAETDDAFMARFAADLVDRPLVYFYRETFRLMKGDLKRFEDDTLGPKIARIKLALNPDTPSDVLRAVFENKNTNHCYAYNRQCAFLNLCKGAEYEREAFNVRENKHTELLDEEG